MRHPPHYLIRHEMYLSRSFSYNTTKQLPESLRRVLELERKNEAVVAGACLPPRSRASASVLTLGSQRLLICERSLKLQVCTSARV